MTHTVTFTTQTGGLYTATAQADGTIAVDGIDSAGRPVNVTGRIAGFVTHPGFPGKPPVFYVGDGDPVDHRDGETVWDHTRHLRTGPVAQVLIGGHKVTAATAHELAPLDHLRVPLGFGTVSDPDLGPVVTHTETAYLPEIIADLFGPTGPLFAEIIA